MYETYIFYMLYLTLWKVQQSLVPHSTNIVGVVIHNENKERGAWTLALCLRPAVHCRYDNWNITQKFYDANSERNAPNNPITDIGHYAIKGKAPKCRCMPNLNLLHSTAIKFELYREDNLRQVPFWEKGTE